MTSPNNVKFYGGACCDRAGAPPSIVADRFLRQHWYPHTHTQAQAYTTNAKDGSHGTKDLVKSFLLVLFPFTMFNQPDPQLEASVTCTSTLGSTTGSFVAPSAALAALFPSSFCWSALAGSSATPPTTTTPTSNTSTANDIILGRGTLHAKHPGNVRFYKLVDQFLEQYNAAETKLEKTNIIHEIYERVLQSGQRFVKQEPPNEPCELVMEGEAKKKIGHTMRYRQKLHRSKMQKSGGMATPPTSTSSSESCLESTFSRSGSLQSLVTEEDKANLTKPLPAPPRLFKFDVPGSKPSEKAIKQLKGIFSDEELDTVLGTPEEATSSSSSSSASSFSSASSLSAAEQYLDMENWNQFDEDMDFTTVSLSF